MPNQILHLSLTKDQLADLVNALEDYRDDFRTKAADATRGFGLDKAYWDSRVAEVQLVLELVSVSGRLNRH
ncbi:hypothetical protein ACX5K5_07350 [Glutamicibacter bergerei]|jgi:hypothetical protein|uniref:Uncharacterized protein n=2 Tax=Glutamicibacter TaxID=1742989 RepID=A0ABV9MKY9_9MICC|nr:MULTISPECIES: hypothetical protein [Glutamicibacter]PCC36268.1 hypothetical protein CIK74_06595 [Glutamicibacter sp. BW77]GGJ61442.1 hypothetical protein GCM10007173_20270 [Glutamicibacter ardleyensis]